MTMTKLLRLLATTALASMALPAFAQTDPSPRPSPQPSGVPATSPTAPGRTGTDSSSTDATRVATGDQAPDNANASGANAIGDIVVTANRVASSAQKTAVSLSVFSGADIAAAGVTSVQNLGSIDPSVNVTTSTGSNYVAVRGIASTDVTEIGDPSVPIARDGFFTNRSFGIATSIYDLQRVEVLKGPQGTLFGRNSTGGLINIITRRPGKDLGANASIEYGNYDTVNAEAGADIPVGDRIQLRFSGVARRHEGYRYLTGVNLRGDDDDTVSGRATVAFQPFEGFDGLVQYQHDEVDDVGDVAAQFPVGQRLPAGFDEKRFPNYDPTFYRLNGDRVRWEFSYDRLPLGLTLTYAGGVDKQKFRHALDAAGANGANPSQFLQAENPKTWNHEVRLATPQDGVFSFQGGYFHFDEENNLDSGLINRAGPFAGRYLIRFNYNVKTQSDAVFGQLGFRPIDTVRISGGARYTWDKKDRTGQAVLDLQVASGGFLPPIIITTPGNGSIRQHKPTFHVGVDWTPTNRALVYAKFDTGYKSGGFNSNGSAPSVDYGPENLKAFEVGTKNRFADNHLQLNLAGFYQDYSGYQASQPTAVIAGAASGIFNLGSAKIYGLEGQFIAQGGGARFDLNGTYLHARFDDDAGIVVRGDNSTANVGGKRLPNAPRFAASAGVEYALQATGFTITPRIDGKFSSAFFYSVFNDADTRQKSYVIGNASITVALANSPIQLQLFVRNLADKQVFANAARNYTATPAINVYQFQPPRTYGARLSFNY